jgi:hypothetical protein
MVALPNPAWGAVVGSDVDQHYPFRFFRQQVRTRRHAWISNERKRPRRRERDDDRKKNRARSSRHRCPFARLIYLSTAIDFFRSGAASLDFG